MSELRPAGLAGLLHALQPPVHAPEPVVEPGPDPVLLRAAEDRALEEAAHARGRAEGRAEAEAALVPAVAALSAAAQAFEAACRIEPGRLRAPLAELVRALCERVLATELQASAAILLPLVEAGLAELRLAEPAVLRAKPELLALLNDHCADALAHVQLQPDPAMADAVELSGPDFIIHASLGDRLDDLLETRP
jgi:flagellar biosynthesis/type III secretory pathway protein FliH